MVVVVPGMVLVVLGKALSVWCVLCIVCYVLYAIGFVLCVCVTHTRCVGSERCSELPPRPQEGLAPPPLQGGGSGGETCASGCGRAIKRPLRVTE